MDIDWQQSLWDGGSNSPVELKEQIPIAMSSSSAVISEDLNVRVERTTSEQNNMKESDMFSKVAREIEVLNSLCKMNSSKFLGRKPQANLNVWQFEEDESEYVGLAEEASESGKDNSDGALNKARGVQVSAGGLSENCQVKWLVCTKYPACPVCTIEIEQSDVQAVSDF